MGGPQFAVHFLRVESVTQGRGDQVLGQNIQGKGYRIAWFNVTGVEVAAARRSIVRWWSDIKLAAVLTPGPQPEPQSSPK